MLKVMAMVQLILMCLLQVSTDWMLIGTFIENGCQWDECLIGFMALVVCSVILVRLSWKEWKQECEK